ncbi:MAG: hypothetical protein OXC48_12055 [Endozoicomonadaceae bacterium]|nr:hypothetical protein [Endozoicomonadaceae bacterium]
MKQFFSNSILLFSTIILTLISKNAYANHGCFEGTNKVDCFCTAGELNESDNIVRQNFDQYDDFGIPIAKCAVYYDYVPDDLHKNKNFLNYIRQITIVINQSFVCKFDDIIIGNCMVDGGCNTIEVKYDQNNPALGPFVKTLPVIVHEKFYPY